jgi:hypothetical protein
LAVINTCFASRPRWTLLFLAVPAHRASGVRVGTWLASATYPVDGDHDGDGVTGIANWRPDTAE